MKQTKEELIESLIQMKKDLDQMIEYKSKLPRLSLEDHEDITDNYQAHLELSYEIPSLRYDIARLEEEIESMI